MAAREGPPVWVVRAAAPRAQPAVRRLAVREATTRPAALGGDHTTGGTGGDHATGGAVGDNDGRRGWWIDRRGGHAGTAGAQTGGNAGAGGHPAGGQGGSGETCAQLAADYLAALPTAKACTTGAANQCQQLEPITLGNCADCKRSVSDTTTLSPIISHWTQQVCGTSGPVCAIACISPGNAGNCVPTVSAAPAGVCGNGIATPQLN